MFNFIKNVIKRIRVVIHWLFEPESLTVVKIFYALAREIAKRTPTEQDDKFLEYLVKLLNDYSKKINGLEKTDLESKVNKASEGELKEYVLGYTQDGIKLANNIGSVLYNPKNGAIEFGIKIDK